MERLKTMTILALLAALAGSIALAATSGEAEVRINARKLEDGRVEFALQQRVDGEWGERILPPSRYFPTDATVGRWLNSTPLTVSVATEGAGALEGDSPEPPGTSTSSIRTAVGDGVTPSGAFWSVWLDDFTDERKAIVFAPTDSDSTIYEPTLVFRCSANGSELEAWFSDLPVSDVNDQWRGQIRWGNTSAQTLWLSDNSESGEAAFLPNPADYRQGATSYDMVRIRLTGHSRTVTATINVAAMRDAPTWANILACGT